MSGPPETKLLSIIESAVAGLRGDRSAPVRPAAAVSAARNGELEHDPIIDELVWSYLVWEAGETRAAPRYVTLTRHFVDMNDLRVGLPVELTGIIGVTYPKAAERAERLVATLNSIYDREHAVSLSHLSGLNKREAKAYLADLNGIPPYVAGRVGLLALDIHAFPLDERLAGVLRREHALPDALDADAAALWAERQIKAGEAAAACSALEHWARDRTRDRRPKRKPRPRPADPETPTDTDPDETEN